MEETGKIEKLVLIILLTRPLLSCLVITIHWSFLLNQRKTCFIFLHLMLTTVKSFHKSSIENLDYPVDLDIQILE